MVKNSDRAMSCPFLICSERLRQLRVTRDFSTFSSMNSGKVADGVFNAYIGQFIWFKSFSIVRVDQFGGGRNPLMRPLRKLRCHLHVTVVYDDECPLSDLRNPIFTRG